MLKFLVFSDYHYWKGHYPNPVEGFDELVARAQAAKADFILHCGDLCHNAPTAPELQTHLIKNAAGIPVLGCIGNHEVEDAAELNDVLEAYEMPNNYYCKDFGIYRFICLDTNYFIDEDETLVHNKPYTHSAPNGDRLTPEQLDWLRESIETAPGKCVLFSHASLEYPVGSPTSPEVYEILKEYEGKVVLLINGHHHTDNIAQHDGAVWLDVNATYNAFWAPMDNPKYPEEFKASARMARQCCFTDRPISALVTLTDEGDITIEGTAGQWLFGVDPADIGYAEPNRFGRIAVPHISSFEGRLFE